MEELSMILRAHALRYPCFQPTDAVKLIYQNEFGGGHMIRDKEACRAYLRREYEETPHADDAPLIEPIGNGIVRVHLTALAPAQVDTLADVFIRSASLVHGSVEAFEEKLMILRALTAEGVFAFDLPALEAYLRAYVALGYPPVSHSEGYREAYHPAYRVVKEELCAPLAFPRREKVVAR